MLSFAHRGFAQADEGYARVTTGWGYYLASLQLYLERRSKSERGLSRKTYLQRVSEPRGDPRYGTRPTISAT